MTSGELLIDQAGTGGPVNILARQAMASMGMELGQVATAQENHVGDRLGDRDPTCPEQWADKRLISLDDLARLGNAPVVFSGLKTEAAAEYEDDLAVGRLVVTNASANRTRPDVPVVNAFVNAGHIDELYARDMPGRIIAGGNCLGDILIPTVAALDRGIGVKGMVVETLQGHSGAGRAEVPKDMDDITDITGDEREKINTEPLMMLGASMDQPADITIASTPRRGPWVRGHQAAVRARLSRETSKHEVEHLWRHFKAPSALNAVKAELKALSQAGGEKWPSRHQPIRPIKVTYHELVRHDLKPAKLTAIHPMRVNAHFRQTELSNPSVIQYEVAGDNLMIGAVGVNLLNVIYARAQGYLD